MQTTHYWWSHLQLQSKPGSVYTCGLEVAFYKITYDRGRFYIMEVGNRRMTTAASTHTTNTMKGSVVQPRVDSPMFREIHPNHVKNSDTGMTGVPLEHRWYVSTCIPKEGCSGVSIRAVVPTHYWIKHGRQLNSHVSTMQQEANSFIREPHTRPPERLSQVNQHVWLPPRSNVF